LLKRIQDLESHICDLQNTLKENVTDLPDNQGCGQVEYGLDNIETPILPSTFTPSTDDSLSSFYGLGPKHDIASQPPSSLGIEGGVGNDQPLHPGASIASNHGLEIACGMEFVLT
jgi:hypothetical protein